MTLDDQTCVPVPCPEFETLDLLLPPQARRERADRVPVAALPEVLQARIAADVRHPQCLITAKHEPHDMIRAGRAGWRCGGAAKGRRD